MNLEKESNLNLSKYITLLNFSIRDFNNYYLFCNKSYYFKLTSDLISKRNNYCIDKIKYTDTQHLI